jgi:iron complex outermembrane receptor protein
MISKAEYSTLVKTRSSRDFRSIKPGPLSTAISAVCAGLLVLSMPVHTAAAAPDKTASEPIFDFTIPAGSLSDALLQFSETSGQRVLFNADLVRGINSNGLQGRFAAQQALEKLLNGSGLAPRQTGSGSVTLEKQADRSESSQNPATLSAVTVVGKNTYEDNDPYNPSYTRHAASSATKTDTPLMETPVNIQVIPKAVLDDQQTIQMTQALKNVAGASVSSGSGGLSDDIFLRGFRTSTYFRNGFRIDSQYGSIGTRQMANVERLEVIKGPAAIMYGRMEPGGMVNVVTKQALAKPYYALQQQFGSFDLYRTTLDATGPLTKDDTLLYRFNGSFESSGSFRELVDNERTFLAPVVTWNLGHKTQVTLEMEYRHDNLNYDPMVWPVINGQPISMPRSRNLMERTPSKVEEKLIGLNWSHQFNDDWSLKQRFVADLMDFTQAWTFAAADALNPDDTLPRAYNLIPGLTNTYFTTLDLTGHFTTGMLSHTLLVGGDYYRTDNITHPYGAALNPINIYNPVHDAQLTSPLTTAWSPSNNSADYFGLYAQDQIKLPYGLHVMGGLRYQNVKQWDNLAKTAQPADDAVTPRVGVLWQAQDWLSFYGNYIENFGVSNQWAATATGKPLPPESAQQWEVGTKTEFFDGRLSATLAYFDLTKQNVVTPDPDNRIFSKAVGEIRSQGPEIDIRGQILPGWNLIATYTNLNARITKDFSGNQGARPYAVPRNMGSIWTTYDFQQGDFRNLKIGGGITLRDGTSDGTNRGYPQTAGYATVDLLAAYTWKVGGSKITTQLNVNNLLDKNYLQDTWISGASTRPTIGTPRSLLGSIKVEF